ncbi:BLUF domain-containing protein [Leucobacter sp. wl10]|uniref:BLUF domain-containing protein n=1 Tax=Leucobacter sp. wl10 TaxID=2304677 RepID=UPI000E5A4080|nr:BLUF domain-containing protein [Leucobacter sp. wl10]RGE20409.1 BLUF domain-containing protein [Leucobacter sp. wl10]
MNFMPGAAKRIDGALRSLVYSSLAVTRFYEEDLQQLLARARAHNGSVGITGILLYRRDQFIQFLEGPPEEVDALMRSIEHDPRHTNVRILIDELVVERQFDDWTMGYRPLTQETAVPLPGLRDSFADIAAAPDAFVTGRAAKELALWFKVRARPRTDVNAPTA